MVELNPDTGMPVVPEGYFWRVKSEQNSMMLHPVIHVQLRKKRWYGSQNISELGFTAKDDSTELKLWGYWRNPPLAADKVAEAVQRLAVMVYKQQKVELDYRTEYAATEKMIEKLTGDYPPKKLEAN